MPSINITELDQTTPGSVLDTTDIVFIPGFVDIQQASLNPNGTYIGIQANNPQLFTSVSDFEAMCGTKAPVFTVDQPYPENGSIKFSTDAIPTDSLFIKAGEPDPSYIMAKELIAAGLPVLYQRVNENATINSVEYVAVATEVANGLNGKTPVDSDSDFYYKDGDNYLLYKEPINYPNFEDYKDSSGDPIVFKLNTLENISYAELVNYYNTGYTSEGVEITDGSAYPYYYDDEQIKEGNSSFDTSLPTFREALLIKVADHYEYCSTKNIPALPEETDGSKYALLISHAVRPTDWSTNYFEYYQSVTETVSRATVTKFEKIAKVADEYKKYDKANIYTMVDTTSYSFSVQMMYNALDEIFALEDDLTEDIGSFNVSGLADRGNHDVKYLTSGGYPVFEYGSLANKMIKLAKHRGDCVALIDHTDNRLRPLNPNHPESLYTAVKGAKDTAFSAGEFGAMFTPWAEYSRLTTDDNQTSDTFRAPGSYAYLGALADSIKTNANWLAIAGVNRGQVQNLSQMTTIIPNGVADKVQTREDGGIAINAITNIKPYGWTIWGNRTLKANPGNLVATSFLNIRNLVSDVKKTCYRTARTVTFEQDTDILWINFKSEISKLLDQMKSGYGISGYKILRDNSHARANDKATLCAKVIIYPVEAVEDFYITIVLKDDEVSVN